MQSKVFNIEEIIQSPSALTREQGGMVYEMIPPYLSRGYQIILDFEAIESLITPFLNVAIGKLYENYSSEQLRKSLVLKNIPDGTGSKFQTVIDNAKQYYKNRDNFNKAVQKVMDNE